ncbi:PIN domain-containing protein [Flavobacterium sp. JAS]|uniref:PIN domain-containing protein n=1 Tax=Flavobacterium sp. JAS TaxID=2897329 RepID=UPI001E54FDC4|nr:PIN domain-containing protein [Flavobacterium sp. JAS]MCD0472571.1 PIN domain-containing protein [Flavobacterium sp. JAS]
MDIILDSNIFRSDITLRSKEFDVILDYLDKTHSSIVIPQIILDEIKGLYGRTLQERKSEVAKNINNLNLLIIDNNKHIKSESFNVVNETDNYEKYIIEKLKIRGRNIIPYNNDFLPLISERAIKRIKPAGEKGQGFRDTLIWLTMKDYCQSCHEKQITFISNNTDDFASADKTNLNESLKEECDILGIKINYFKTVKEFIENHSTKIDLISYDWIADNLDYDYLRDLVVDYLNSNQKRIFISTIQNKIGEECESYKALRFDPDNDDDLSVYEMLDNQLIVNFLVSGYVDLELNIVTYESWGDNPRYYINTINRYERVKASVTLTLIENEIIETEINDVYI